MSVQTPRLSIGLPVYNGERFVGEAIESMLGQTFGDFELIISDNASTDNTEGICRAYASRDKRVRYYRNQDNLGAAQNYTRVFELAVGKYFKWAAHDDVCLPEFLSRCVEVLDKDPSVVLCYTSTITVGEHGQFIRRWPPRPALGSMIVRRRFREILGPVEHFAIWGVIRANILRKTRLLGNYPEHDRPLLSALCLHGRFWEVPEFLFFDRDHKERSIRKYDFRRPHEALEWYDPRKMGRITLPSWRLFAEHTLGIRRAELSLRDRIACYLEMSRWLRRHAQELMRDVIIASKQIPGLGSVLAQGYGKYVEKRWSKKTKHSAKEIKLIIRPGDVFVLADDAKLDNSFFAQWGTIPFLERDGKYWGPPPDGSTAIEELERLRRSGVNFIVFAWPTFWWFDYYSEFYEYLRSKFSCVLKNDRLVVFDLRL